MHAPRLIFAGTPAFAVPSLRALIRSGQAPVAVYTQPDRPSGRGRKTRPSPVKTTALDAGIPVHQPPTLRDASAGAKLVALEADLMIVAAYGLILPQTALDAPRLGCVNIHASLLPRWRGAAPIQRAILAGDEATGICIMRMEAGLDTGPVFRCREVAIAADDTGGSLHDRLAAVGADLLLEVLPGILDGSLAPVPQDHARATYAKKLEKAEAAVDWSRDAPSIERQVRAFNPWPVAQTRLDGEVLRLWLARALPGSGGPPGAVLHAGREGIDVATGDGLLRILSLQAPGKRPVDAAAFVNSRDLGGTIFG
jgi:methionyl-tRNA formyltransferase